MPPAGEETTTVEAVGPQRRIRADVSWLGPLLNWPRRLQASELVATAQGIELVFRNAHVSQARLLLFERPGSTDGGLSVSWIFGRANARVQAAMTSALCEAASRAAPEIVELIGRLGRTVAALHSNEPRADLVNLRLLLAAVEDDAVSLPTTDDPVHAAAAAVVAYARTDIDAALRHADRAEATMPASVGQAFMRALTGRGAEVANAVTGGATGHSRGAVRRGWAQLAIAIKDWRAAFEASRACLDPDDPNELASCIRLAVSAGATDWARRAVRRLIGLPSTATSQDLRVEALRLLAQTEHANDVFALIADMDQVTDAHRLVAAEVALRLDRHDEAIAWIDQIADDAHGFEVARNRGAVAVRQGEYDRGIQYLTPLLQTRPRDRETTLWLAEAHIRARRVLAARQVLQRFDKKVTGEHPIAKLMHGYVELEAEYRDPEFPNRPGSTLYIHRNLVRDVLGSAARGVDDSAAVEREDILRAVDEFGGNRSDTLTLVDRTQGSLRSATHVMAPRVRVVQAQHAIDRRPVAAVKAELARLARQRPDVPYATTYEAELGLWTGDYAEAGSRFEAIWKSTRTRWGYVGWGACQIMLGHHERGLEILDAGVREIGGEIDGEATPAYRGEALAALGRREQALAELRRAVALRPNRIGAWLTLARVLDEYGARAEAIAAADKFVAAAPVLVWEAHKCLGLTPATVAADVDRWAVLQQCQVQLRGNRSSYLLTFADAAGRLRVMETAGHLERFTTIARRIRSAAVLCAVQQRLPGLVGA